MGRVAVDNKYHFHNYSNTDHSVLQWEKNCIYTESVISNHVSFSAYAAVKENK